MSSLKPRPKAKTTIRPKQVHVNILVSEELRNTFKAKAAMKGKRVKDVLEEFMKEYIKI